MTNPYGNSIVMLDGGWALAMNQIGDGTAISGRVNGYVATSAQTAKAIRATTYTPQGANAQRSVNSTSASDAAAGTGARTIKLNYLDASFVLKSETITLNGTTAVNTVATDIAYIESIVVQTVGSGGGNVGTIQVWTAINAGGSVWGSIAASDNQTFWAHHYVPAGQTCYVLAMSAGALAVAAQTNINRIGDPAQSNLPQLQFGTTVVHGSADTKFFYYTIPLIVPGPDLIWLTTKPTANTASTSYGSFDYVQF